MTMESRFTDLRQTFMGRRLYSIVMGVARKQLKEAEKKLDASIKAAKKNANLDALLTLDTLSKIINAQNFSMPAGYVKDKKSRQWLIEINENFKNKKQLKNLVLTKISGVGKIRMSDVADVVVVDNLQQVVQLVAACVDDIQAVAGEMVGIEQADADAENHGQRQKQRDETGLDIHFLRMTNDE